MKLKFLLFIFSFKILCASCQTATNDILEDFKKLDSSLQKSNSLLIDNVYSRLYAKVQAKKSKNLVLAFEADTLFQATEDALKFIDNLKQKINELDPLGTQIDIGSKLLINTPISIDLTNKLKAVYLSCISSLIDKQKKTEAENIFNVIKEIKKNKNWTSNYFDQSPTFAIITFLNKFKNDCINLAVFSLTEINDKLVE